jgi:formate dehydrogenase gamma subunit
MKSIIKPISIAVIITLHLSAALKVNAQDPDNCMMCHQFRGLTRYDSEADRVHLFYVDPGYIDHLEGPHARLACTDCHERKHVSVIPHEPVPPVDCARTCHLSDRDGIARRFSHEDVAVMMQKGVHNDDLLERLEFQQGPLLNDGQSNCLYCHDEPQFRGPTDLFPELTGDQLMARCNVCHTDQLSIDAQYYLKHVVARMQPARPHLEIAQACAVCHSDPAIKEEFELSDAVASYLLSFHGKAVLLGENDTAGCLSCHAGPNGNVHEILAQDNPASSVHSGRIATTCSTIDCHPGADPGFVQAAVHWNLQRQGDSLEFLLAFGFILLTALTFGPSAVLAILELVQMVAGREASADEEMKHLARRAMADEAARKKLKRFTAPQRIQHWILAILFITLVATGFPMKFADRGWAAALVQGMGGLTVARHIHHYAGLLLFVALIFYVVFLISLSWQRGRRFEQGRIRGFIRAWFALPMWMTFQDAKKLIHLMQYLLFLRPDRPTFGRFSLKEKFEYLGVFWGTLLLGLTGIVLWGETISTKWISGRLLNLAAIAHTYEAFLAVIHVGILHMYGVLFSPHVFPMSPAMITGNTPVGEMAELHSDQLKAVAAELGINTTESQVNE